MPTSQLPFDESFIRQLQQQFPTPFYIYDEAAIRANAQRLNAAFDWSPQFKEFFAVKATPNPHILRMLQEEGCGADCSSLAELLICERLGLPGGDVMFTSNNTPLKEYEQAIKMGAIVNIDDITHIDYLDENLGLPELLSFRYNPGPLRSGNAIIGNPEEAKFGFTRPQVFEGVQLARQKGVQRFGMHTMVCSNELNPEYFVETARMLFTLVREVHQECDVQFEFVNLGGGMGIPYRPEEKPLDLELVSRGIHQVYQELIEPSPLHPLQICLENGRIMTGPYGYLITQAIHQKHTYREYVGVDACMANLMRPGMYGAYHHVSVLGKENEPATQVVDVVGSLCENNDKFAIQRSLPTVADGDILVLHDAGAHGHSMGFQYNGKLRCAELLMQTDGTVRQIRRAETLDDYFSTLDWESVNST